MNTVDETWTVRNRTFTDSTGAGWTVMATRAMVRRADGWNAMADTVRTFARRNSDGVEVDMEAGCSFQAERVVRQFNEQV
jgi:hypothetical protein